MNINNPTSFSTPDLTLSTSNSSGTSGALRADDTILVYDTTVPGTITAGASAATGDSETAARRNHVHGSAAAYTTFAAPSFTLGTSNVSGSGDSVHAGATLLAFDATLPDSISFGQSAAVGSAVVSARRDHSHGMVADPSGLVLIQSLEADDDASLTLTGISSDYDSFLILGADLVPAENDKDLYLRCGAGSIDSGAGDYQYYETYNRTDVVSYTAMNATSATLMLIAGNVALGGLGNAGGEGAGFAIWLLAPTDGTMRPTFTGSYVMINGSGDMSGGEFTGMRDAVIAIDRVQIFLESGNIATGRMSLWGVNHA